MPPQKVTYRDLVPGFEFPLSRFKLEPPAISAYLRAVSESSGLFPSPEDIENDRRPGPVPPTAITALATCSLMEKLTLPPGSLHLSQEMEMLAPAQVGELFTCRAAVAKRQERAGLRLLTIEITVLNAAGQPVQTGRMLVTVPGAE